MAIHSPRMTPPLNLTPRVSSPYVRSPSPKSPSRVSRSEQGLILQRVVGTTTNSINGFDGLESTNCFAFLAGGAAVVATLDDDLQLSQKFFRAKPSSLPLNPPTSIYDSPTPSYASNSSRGRTSLAFGGSAVGVPSFGSPSAELATDSPTNKLGIPVDQRTKTATCLSLSRDGKLVAIGETGHKPRILIFSTAKDAPVDRPLTAISEHFFGVRCLAFSPDSKYLASLGDANDGFLYIWAINSRTASASLHASNKCTSFIRQISWMGKALITIGTRHVKIWRIQDAVPDSPRRKRYSEAIFTSPSPSPSKTLFGRNCLLGPLLDMTFTCITVISTSEAFVCSVQGDICLLRDDDKMCQFTKVAKVGFCVNTIVLLGEDALVVAGDEGQMKRFKKYELLAQTSTPKKDEPAGACVADISDTSTSIVAMTRLKDRSIALDSNRNIRILSVNEGNGNASLLSVSKELYSHRNAVQGVQTLATSDIEQPNFITWSTDGSVLFWRLDGSRVKEVKIDIAQANLEEEEWLNELKIVQAFADNKILASGDRLGAFRITDSNNQHCLFEVRAHAGEITDIAILDQNNRAIIATAGRDRMVQVFEWKENKCNLIQTLDEHVGAVSRVLFTKDGKKLVSCSSDRTIIVRDYITGDIDGKRSEGFLFSRTITMKTSPLSLAPSIKQETHILVSTADKRVLEYDLACGSLLSGFRVSDPEGGDAVTISPLIQVCSAQGIPLVAGVSSTDKSLRIYDGSGRLLRRDYGHSEGMTGIAALESPHGEQFLVTVASDGTIFVWNFSTCSVDQLQGMFDGLQISESTPGDRDSVLRKPPLRRVLSSSEIAQLQGFREQDPVSSNQSTPTGPSQRVLKKKSSKLSLAQAPNFEPSPLSKVQHTRDFSSSVRVDTGTRRASVLRSPSPSSPRRYAQTMKGSPRQASMGGSSHSRRRSLSTTSVELRSNDLVVSTEQLCRTLHTFRRKLTTSSDVMPADKARELEKELSAAAKALAEKASRNETVMVKLLDQYSERLESMLDEKIASTLAKQMRNSSGAEDVVDEFEEDKINLEM